MAAKNQSKSKSPSITEQAKTATKGMWDQAQSAASQPIVRESAVIVGKTALVTVTVLGLLKAKAALGV